MKPSLPLNLPSDLTPVHEDPHLLVLDKPSGLLCVPGRGEDKQDCLSARVQARWPEALVVHRLDMATSGLVLMARSPAVQRALSDAFAEQAVWKRYEAVVDGVLAEDPHWSVIDAPLMADWPRRPLQKIDPEGKPSVTRWRVLEALPALGASRLLLEPRTGRTHQLRVHLASIGHPILGDALYADAAVQARASRLMLHASVLQFRHPVDGQALRFESPAPF
ncbi:RluA family pseudouridine synthase [Variovorax boronicumulans]|uniref:RluA family pseudouridine synthase n=1 Tax=Variovorax boronicumulans TaxID=436515 RepID=UPI001C57F5E2